MSLIDKILTEWAYRVHDGMPNIKNPQHVIKLKESMEELSLPKEFIFEFIQNLFEEKQKPLNDKDKDFLKKKGLVWKGYANGYGKEGKDNPILYKNVDGKLQSVSGEEPDSTGEEPTEEPPEQQSTPNVVQPKKNQFAGDEDEKKPKDNIDNLSNDQLRQLDHDTTDSQLNLTKAEAKAQAEKKGEKGVGAGTPESRAGEAAVHYAVRKLVGPPPGNIDDIKKHLLDIAKDKDKILDAKWANAAINTAQWIHDVYGDDIGEVVWDTPAGRKLIGVEGHGTSSDMFIKTKDGKRIGISLKQTTAVFLLNGGYNTQHGNLIDSLRENLSEEELEEFEKLTSVKNYEEGFRKNLTAITDDFTNNSDFKNAVINRIEEYKNMSDEEFVKIFDSLGYKKHLDDFKNIIDQLPHVTQDKIKFICKVMKDPEIRKKFPHYDNLRNQEIIATQAILAQATSNENVAKGLKKVCLDGMHVEDILFGKSEQLDEFVTLYGNDPAVELDKGVLLSIFDLKDEYEQYLSLDNEEDKEEFKKQLLEKMNEKLILDIKDGAKAGEVKIKHSGPPKQEFHLFGIKARAKALGASLSLEMFQTSFMGNVIKEGTVDISQWKTSTKKKFVNKRIKEILEDMEDSNEEQKQALGQEIEDLKAIL
jgi:hypothetical protein